MGRRRDLCERARDVDESVESLIRCGACDELSIYVIADDWPVRLKNDAKGTVTGPVFLLAEDLHRCLNAECTTVRRVKQRIDDEPIILLQPVEVDRGVHFVMAEEAERFCRNHALTLRSSTETPSYLDPNHEFYATELAIAVKAWMALFADGSFEQRNKTPKEHIALWLRARKIDLSGTAIERITTLANPDSAKKGGPPRTPNK